ncbi:hypothetical protein F4803DRAFT_574354 [Xylaria telfairii]|nr:hypothetical protein F4803DRAFT_574354 [Xylaria telfairii]
MERLCQAMMALALVVPTLAVPGVIPTSLQQQPMDQQPLDNGLRSHHHHKTLTHVTQMTIGPSPTSSSEAITIMSSPTELVERGGDKKPDLNPCTPGDRFCHSSLFNILFCNEDQQWTKYAECPKGTFCHRLNMVCVAEILPSIFEPDLQNQQVNDDPSYKCKEGDRRCSTTFNRVDRCNGNHEWVTYHDCRKSELCNVKVSECLPIQDIDGKSKQPQKTATKAGTAPMSI